MCEIELSGFSTPQLLFGRLHCGNHYSLEMNHFLGLCVFVNDRRYFQTQGTTHYYEVYMESLAICGHDAWAQGVDC